MVIHSNILLHLLVSTIRTKEKTIFFLILSYFSFDSVKSSVLER